MAKGLGNLLGGGGDMIQRIQQLQQQLAESQAKLAAESVSATSGRGAVTVRMTGDQKCTAVSISADLLKDADAEMVQDLVLSAVNQALDKSRALAAKHLGPLAGRLPF